MVDVEERKKIYSETRRDLLSRQLSNAENFDKAILSLSTAGLGFSLAFMKDIIPLGKAGFLDLIYYSWYLFGGAIVSTLLSFHSSQIGIDKQLILAERYYIKCDEKALKTTGWARLTVWLNRLSGIFFIAAIFLTIAFVILNVRR